jgi:hypothetical protein
MNRTGKIALWLAGGLALNAGARADTVASAGNPYTPVVARNIFGLNPVQAADAAPIDPPPKITLTGIMSISGKAQVLFKAAGPGKPGQPAKDQFYILSLSQRQDDIEVTRINEKTGLVTFNNHGTVQEIPLASTPALTTAPAPVPGPGGPAGRGFQPGFGRPPTGGSNPNMGGTVGGFASRNYSGQPSGQSSAGGAISPEQAAAAIISSEQIRNNTEQLKSAGNPTWQIMPPPPLAPLKGK